MNKIDTKSNLRNKYKKIREDVLFNIEKTIIKEVKKEIESRLRDNTLNDYLAIYWPLYGEIDLRSLKKDFKLPIALPASTKEGTINYHKWSNMPLKSDFNGIPSPLEAQIVKPQEISLLLVPAIAIDYQGYRLGYGGGFFDRLRVNKQWRSIPSMVVLPKACISETPLPQDSYDIPFDGWINEQGSFLAKSRTYV